MMGANEITHEEVRKFFERLHDACEGINIREINCEAWYQELLEKSERNENEQFLFEIMNQSREAFIRIEESYKESVSNLVEDINKINSEFVIHPRYYDWDSRPIQQWEYSFKHTYFPIHVNKTIINGWLISTVWLGLNHSFWKNNYPIIFETMIFKDDESVTDGEHEEFENYQERYSFLAEAEEGHKRACEFVKGYNVEKI